MLAAETHERRILLDRARRLAGGSSRWLDFAIEFAIADDPDAPSLAVGGRLDTVTRTYDGDPEAWPVMPVGRGQLPPLAANGGRWVVVGAMGAGKTELLARAVLKAALLRGRNRDIGVVAPTIKRLRICWQKLIRLLPPAWVIGTRSEQEITLVNGCRLQFVAAKRQSADVGSPIQGYSWVACFPDEEQDIDDDAMADIMLRGRDAPGGDFLVVSTCTLKDTPQWRARKARYERDPATNLYRMEARANPFVAPEYWETLRAQLSERQYRMRVLALDARPELAVYPEFTRERNTAPVPAVGARDVTRAVVGRSVLVGHDPGQIFDVSLLLKAYAPPGSALPTWYVVGEVTTEQATTDAHVRQVERWLHARDLSPSDAQVVADPYGNRKHDDQQPDVTVYKVWIQRGFKIRPAAYAKGPQGPSRPGVVPREAGIELVNSLLCSADDVTRLVIATDERGAPCAPRLVGALEMSERDANGRAEQQRKSRSDVSHWPAALRYALWPFERVRIQAPAWQGVISGNP